MHERNKVHRAQVRAAGESELATRTKMQRKSEPTITEFLELADNAMKGSILRFAREDRKASKQHYASVQEKQKPKGKPNAREWVVQTAKGGMFGLRHRASGDWYSDYVSTPITSWGAKRFPTAKDTHAFLNDSKNFAQSQRKA